MLLLYSSYGTKGVSRQRQLCLALGAWCLGDLLGNFVWGRRQGRRSRKRKSGNRMRSVQRICDESYNASVRLGVGFMAKSLVLLREYFITRGKLAQV
jgi:hypothetical protein